MHPRITLRQLEFLVSLSKHLHFGKAAKECCLSQAAFSLGIKKIEEQLSLKLAERNKKQTFFTPAGWQIVEQAKLILHEAEKLNDIVASCQKPFSGKMRLGVIPTIAPFILPEILPAIKKKWQDLQISICENLTDTLHKKLLNGELDVILVALPYNLTGVETISLFKDNFKLAFSKNTKLFAKPYKEEDLPPMSILLLEDGHCLRDHSLSACNAKHHNKISPHAASSLHTLTQMVSNDLGVTFLTDLAIQSGLLKSTNLVVRDMGEKAYREIGLGWRHGSGRKTEFLQLAEFFTEFAPKLGTRTL